MKYNKKIMVMIVSLLSTCLTYSQHITNYTTRIAEIYYGKPQMLTEVAVGEGVYTTIFDENGHILSEKSSKHKAEIKYEWINNKLIMHVYSDQGEFLRSLEFDYIETPNRFYIGNFLGSFDFIFNENGTIHKLITTKNNELGTMIYVYSKENPLLKEKGMIVSDNNKVVAEVMINVSIPDEYGNYTRIVQLFNDKEFVGLRKITYYND